MLVAGFAKKKAIALDLFWPGSESATNQEPRHRGIAWARTE